MMGSHKDSSRLLGVAFLIQFVTSFGSGLFLTAAWKVPGNIAETMTRMSANPMMVRVTIVADLATALGVIFLGAMLYLTLRSRNEKAAIIGMGFYVLEAVILAFGSMETLSLLRTSSEYVAAGNPALLKTIGTITFGTMQYSSQAMMLAFCLGAIPLYYLLYTSRAVPRVLALWGLLTVFPCLFGTMSALLFDHTIPFAFYLPYVPFELVIAVWILVRGVPEIMPRERG